MTSMARKLTKRHRGSPRGGSPSLFLRMLVFLAGCVGTFYLLTNLHVFNNHFSRITEALTDAPTGSTKANPEQQPAKTPINPQIRDTLLQIPQVSVEQVWDSLLEEGSALISSSPQKNLVAMEVGMFRALQCVQAARAGFTAHCVEPSPRNFQRVKRVVRSNSAEIQNRIQLHQKAAGATSGIMLNFSASGGTGDHVGEFDVWNMKVGKTTDKEILLKKAADTVQVASVKMDDIVQETLHNYDERVFVLKVDTQGFEPSVFAGLNDSVFREQRIEYILLEYWPKGIDLLATVGEDGSGVKKSCLAADLLEKLQQAGYTLYALPITAHPAAPAEAKGTLKGERAPMQNPRNNCAYYYELEERFPSPNYKMGYWSDILAVAPSTSLVTDPVTAVGQALKRQQLNETRGAVSS